MSDSAGREVGRISLRVLPNTKSFGPALQKFITRTEARTELNVAVKLDVKGVETGLDRVRKKQEREPIRPPVTPNVDRFASDIRAEAAKVAKSVSATIPVTADGERIRREIDAQVKAIQATTAIDIPLDLTEAAEVRAKMQLELDKLKAMAEAQRPTVHVDVDVDDKKLQRVGDGVSGIALAALTLGPALVPVLGVVLGIAGALAAPLSLAVGGATVFGFLSGFAVKQTNDQLKQIDTLEKKLNTLTAGTAAYTSTQAQLAAATAGLSPAQKVYKKSLDGLKASFDGLLQGTSGDQLLGPISAGIRLVGQLLPTLQPIIAVVSRVLTDLLGRLGDDVSSGGFKTFIDAFAIKLGPVLYQFAGIFQNVFTGIFGLFRGFSGASGGVLSGLVSLTEKFAAFGRGASENKGLQSFVGYVQKMAPIVGSAIGAIVAATVRLAVAFAPIGGVVLIALTKFANLIRAIPIPVLTAAIGTLIASLLLFKAIQLATTIVIGISNGVILAQAAATGIMTVASKVAAGAAKVWAAGQWLLNAALTANPIGIVVVAIVALIAGLVLAYKHSETFRNIVNAAFTVVRDVVGSVISWFASFVPAVFGAVVGAVTAYITAYRTVIITAFNVVQAVVGAVVGWFATYVPAVFSAVVAAVSTVVATFRAVVSGAFNAVRAVVSTVMGAIGSVVSGGFSAVGSIISNTTSTIVDGVRAIPGRLGALAGSFAQVGKNLMQAMVDGLKNAAGIITGIAGNVWDSIRGLLNNAIDKINAALEFKISLPGKDISINPPDIPHLATGARATRSTLAVIGDGREPESVMPDSMLTKALALAASMGPSAAVGASGRGGDIHIHESANPAATAIEVSRRQAWAGFA